MHECIIDVKYMADHVILFCDITDNDFQLTQMVSLSVCPAFFYSYTDQEVALAFGQDRWATLTVTVRKQERA